MIKYIKNPVAGEMAVDQALFKMKLFISEDDPQTKSSIFFYCPGGRAISSFFESLFKFNIILIFIKMEKNKLRKIFDELSGDQDFITQQKLEQYLKSKDLYKEELQKNFFD